MSRLVYRGVAYEPTATTAAQSLAEQLRKPDLVYRGVEHDGERAKPVAQRAPEHVYRGVRYA